MELVTLTIDGNSVEVKKGQTVLDAIRNVCSAIKRTNALLLISVLKGFRFVSDVNHVPKMVNVKSRRLLLILD